MFIYPYPDGTAPAPTDSTTTTSSNYEFDLNGCTHRLPCGICRLMMVQCPKMGYINTTWCGTGTTVGKVDGETAK